MGNEFATADQEISRRFSELRLFWTSVKQSRATPPASQPYVYTAGTGFTVVFLYAALEFSLTRSVRQLSQLITEYSVRASDVCVPLMCLIHDPKIRAIEKAGKKTRLQARLGLFSSVRSSSIARVYDELLTPELQNVWAKSIGEIFAVFGIDDTPLIDMSNTGYIDRIVNDRNAVAHGREPPDVVGSRYTVSEIEELLIRIEREARHCVSSFQRYYDEREFLSVTSRSRYKKRDAKQQN